MKPRCLHLGWTVIFLLVGLAPAAAGGAAGPVWTSRAETPPRKVVIGSAVADFAGSVEARLQLAVKLLDDAVRDAGRKWGKGLDLMVFPEFALCREKGVTAVDRAVSLTEPALEMLEAKVRAHHTWVVMPTTLRESDRISNAAVLFDRTGKVAGVFRKVHPVADDNGVLEAGVTPGSSYPVFDCDFGRLGILICWDMAYEEGWDALAASGAELVALPSASPQNLRPMAEALRHHYYVVNSAPRDNATVFDPTGRTVAQATAAPGVVVQEIDLAFAILHWSETLHEGRALTERFGTRVGGSYSTREDTGVFWSNDPRTSIETMIRTLGLREMPTEIERMETVAKPRRLPPP